jgi:hypothetical protein
VRQSSSTAPDSPAAAAAAAQRDPLGTLIEQHRVTLAGVLLVCGLSGALGVAALGWGWSQQPRTTVALAAMGIGGLVLLTALVLLFMNIFNIGRSLELRKHGIRYTERGQTTQFLWKEIASVETDRLDSTFVGAATKYTRSDNAVAPSGPLTRSEFTVTIVADDGRTIRLPPSFLQCVDDPKKLISKLKVRSGI